MGRSSSEVTSRWLLAYPQGLPPRIECAGRRFELVRLFKHDFFAATALYSACPEPAASAEPPGACPQVVLKLQRRRPFLGLPLGWLGAWLTRHEGTIYRELAGLDGVPAFAGFLGPAGFLHEFVPGRPLGRPSEMRVGDHFFDELAELLSAIHARGLAYVDLNKRQNILVGEDGRPYLIDFQISFRLDRRRGEIPRAILRMLQDHDWYHFYKHKRRCRPDLMTPAQVQASYRRSGWLNAHRRLSWPYFRVRRWLLDRLGLPRGDRAEGG